MHNVCSYMYIWVNTQMTEANFRTFSAGNSQNVYSTTSVQLDTMMNCLNFEVNRSKVTPRPHMVKQAL